MIPENIKIIIISNGHCHRCKMQIFLIADKYNYELYDVNNSKHLNVIKSYGVKNEDDVPLFVIQKNGKEVYRSQAVLPEQRIEQVCSRS